MNYKVTAEIKIKVISHFNNYYYYQNKLQELANTDTSLKYGGSGDGLPHGIGGPVRSAQENYTIRMTELFEKARYYLNLIGSMDEGINKAVDLCNRPSQRQVIRRALTNSLIDHSSSATIEKHTLKKYREYAIYFTAVNLKLLEGENTHEQ